ncbi:hypothetical protein D3C78_1812080 [compost metagenome]
MTNNLACLTEIAAKANGYDQKHVVKRGDTKKAAQPKFLKGCTVGPRLFLLPLYIIFCHQEPRKQYKQVYADSRIGKDWKVITG